MPVVGVFAQESTNDEELDDGMANATPIEYGETIDANLSSPSDVDYYAVDATAGEAILPRLYLKNLFEGSVIAVDVVAPSGEVTTEHTNDQIHGPQNVAGEARPVESTDTAHTADVMESNGTYYLRVSEPNASYAGGEAETNDSATYEYNLTVSTESLDRHEPNENGANASSLQLGTTANATLTGYDNDVYAVNLTAGQSYNMSVESDGNFEKQVNIFDNASLASDEEDYRNNGSVAGQGDEGFFGDVTVTFTPEENGTYYIELTEATVNSQLFTRSNYTITVSETTEIPPVNNGGDAEQLPNEGDADGDGLTNEREAELGTDPRDADTDDDGVSDRKEVTVCETDPLNPADP